MTTPTPETTSITVGPVRRKMVQAMLAIIHGGASDQGTGRRLATAGAVIFIIIAGILHLIVAPQHMSHGVHGWALVLAGVAEVAWGIAFWRKPSAALYRLGVVLVMGLIVLWAITRMLRSPFDYEPGEVEIFGIISKAAEGAGLAGLVAMVRLGAHSGEIRWPIRRIVLASLILGGISAFVIYGAGVAAELVFPGLKDTDHHNLLTAELARTEDPVQISLKSAAVLRELVPLLTRTALAEQGIELEALYQSPVLYELMGRSPPESTTPVIAFSVHEALHDGELPKEAIEFVLRVDDKGPFAPLQVRRLSDEPHHRVTDYLFPGKDSDGSPLIKGGYQVLTLSAAPNGPTGTATVTTLVWRLPISPSTPSGVLSPPSLTDAQVIRVVADDKGFNPNRLTLTKGKRVVLVFQNVGSKEHHLHALKMPAQGIWWFSPPQAGSPVPSDINTLRSVQFLPYHVCDSESGICPSGLDVHLHARVGDWLAISFIPSTAGTFSMTCPLHPYMKGTIVVK